MKDDRRLKAKFTVRDGTKILLRGTLESSPYDWLDESAKRERLEAMLNIERYINTQGSYRMHISVEGKHDD